MYDLILCVLATTKNNRLPAFNKIGYKSTKYKTKIVYLVDEEDVVGVLPCFKFWIRRLLLENNSSPTGTIVKVVSIERFWCKFDSITGLGLSNGGPIADQVIQ